jgi:RNA polymerase sigma-70 factor (sigma-E family)
MRTTMTADDSIASRLEELYVRHATAALRLAYFLTGDPEAARDLVQDAFVRIAGRFRHLRQPDAFDTYLRRTIVNLHASGLRRLRSERSSLAREAALTVPATIEDDHEARDEMWHAILGLPARQRAAIVLRFYEDLSEWQSAEVLGCSVGALNQLVVRAMANLRDRIGEEAR